MLKLNPDMSEKEVERQITDLLVDNPILPGLHTFFIFEAATEIKMFAFVYPGKLADMVSKNLDTLKERGWNATVVIEYGLVYVFFGSDGWELEMPPLLSDGVKGTC